jgi:hypothetical protein
MKKQLDLAIVAKLFDEVSGTGVHLQLAVEECHDGATGLLYYTKEHNKAVLALDKYLRKHLVSIIPEVK